MAVRVPFHLLRRDQPAAAVGLLLESDDPAVLLAASARLDNPLVFPVAGGFLVVADAIPPVAAGIRLRRLSENCFLPADADLVPALITVEAIDLTARRGLVFRPNRPPLAFDPALPRRPASFLAVPKPRRTDWAPFPAGPPIAERLTALIRIVPDPPIDEMLAGEGPPIGTDDARPPQTGVGRRAVGKMSVGIGKGLGALGKAIGSKSLGKLGDKLKAKGTEIAPRITEQVLGQQEAALQHLLKKFREGKTDDALRHAVPIGNEAGRGSKPYGSAQLPTHGLFWSLAGLFGGSGRSAIWAGGNPDTWRDLVAEYHRAARDAAARGDFRRAALIYAKLLSDFRSAAAMLSQGGIHREAGILFRDKVRDPARAAQEFALARDYDEALRLYRESHLYIDAGDLLRRIGEEDLAIAEYHKAADRVVQLRQDHVEAGDILLKKTGRADLAITYFARGWESRSRSLALSRNASVCAERLIEIYALAEDREKFSKLLGEAEDWLAEPGGTHDAGRFFNKVADCAELPDLKPESGEIRARCRLGLANKLQQHAEIESAASTIVSDLFGVEKRWSPAVVSDADFALRAALKHRPKFEKPRPRPVTTISLRQDPVTAAIQAEATGKLFVGFRDGTVMGFDPATGLARLVSHEDVGPFGEAIGLATEPDGTWLAVMRRRADHTGESLTLSLWHGHTDEYQPQHSTTLPLPSGAVVGLLPLIVDASGKPSIGVSTINGLVWYNLDTLVPQIDTGPADPLPPTTYLKLPVFQPVGSSDMVTFQGGSVSWGGKKAYIGWMPDPASGSTLFTPPLAWNVESPSSVQLAGLFDNTHLYYSHITRQSDGSLLNRTLSFAGPTGFRAVAIWNSGRVIGISPANQAHWLRVSGPCFEEWAPATDLPIPAHAVACFPSRRTAELLVVLEDGTLARVPVPI